MEWERTLVILEEMHLNEKVTQRQLSKLTGLSLGTINALIQEMISTGLIKATYHNSRSVSYVVTEKGLKEKNRLNYDFTVKSFKQLAKIRKHIRDKIEVEINNGIHKFYLMGNNDEMLNVVKMCVIEAKRQSNIVYDLVLENDLMPTNEGESYLVWDITNEELIQTQQLNYVNVLLG